MRYINSSDIWSSADSNALRELSESPIIALARLPRKLESAFGTAEPFGQEKEKRTPDAGAGRKIVLDISPFFCYT